MAAQFKLTSGLFQSEANLLNLLVLKKNKGVIINSNVFS